MQYSLHEKAKVISKSAKCVCSGSAWLVNLFMGIVSTYLDWVLLGCQTGALLMHCAGCRGLAERKQSSDDRQNNLSAVGLADEGNEDRHSDST
jgi:hypothetical protein